MKGFFREPAVTEYTKITLYLTLFLTTLAIVFLLWRPGDPFPVVMLCLGLYGVASSTAELLVKEQYLVAGVLRMMAVLYALSGAVLAILQL